ncbi:MAG: MmcQ/YjbR family DNA-binding protein [Prolixibacteraceae bacterium]|jgi:predicted DNA-binding protein (MmcQ/YjbR family)|nr:MmcQ/YjbR family DNA-binding protein [Prolixibacteraceae bacterium]
MNIESLREYCLSKKGATESFPFDETSLVFKVMNKMFALTDLEENLWVNVKCNPETAIELRERYSFVMPGFHMNKKHWNTIRIDETVPDTFVKKWVDHSYKLVVKSLSKKLQAELNQ